MGINITQFAPPVKVSNLVWDQNMIPGTGKNFQGNLMGDVVGNLTGDVDGRINITGCTWYNTHTDTDNYLNIIPKITLNAYNASLHQTVYVNYPFYNAINFLPKTGIYGHLTIVKGENPSYTSPVNLTTYDKDNNLLNTYTTTSTSIDLSNVYKILATCGVIGNYTNTLIFDGLWVKLPYSESPIS